MARFTVFTDFLRRLLQRPRGLAFVVAANVAAFVAVRIGQSFDPSLLRLIEAPASLDALLLRPWTALTYAFVQVDALHLVANMLLLVFFSRRLGRLSSPRVFATLYLLGAVSGAVVFAILPGGSAMIGSSAAVMSVAVAAAISAPRHRVALLPGVSVQLVWLTAAFVALDLLTLSSPDATAHAAHLGGAAAGALCAAAVLLRQRPMRPVRPQPQNQTPDIDVILRKLQTSGHASLTDEEKRSLFRISSRPGPRH